MQVLDTPNQIHLFAWIARKHALLLEMKGLKRRGRSVKQMMTAYFGLPPRTKSIFVLELIQKEIDKLETAAK